MGWTLGEDWSALFKPKLMGNSALGAALRVYIAKEREFVESLQGRAADAQEPYATYRAAWAALDTVEDHLIAASGQEKLAAMGLAPLLKHGAIDTRQHRLRDTLAVFVADAPGGINHIVDLSQYCEDQISTRASMVSRFERAQMAAAQCRIPAALKRLHDLRADIETVLKSGQIEPEDVVEKSSALHKTLSDLPGDFSAHLKALAMLRTAGLRLGHQKKPFWDWLKRADDVLRAADA